MHMMPRPSHPHEAILNLEGGPEEVLHIRAFKKDLGIAVRIDEKHTGVVITTKQGVWRQDFEPEMLMPVDE